jgi:hypothetical protein
MGQVGLTVEGVLELELEIGRSAVDLRSGATTPL